MIHKSAWCADCMHSKRHKADLAKIECEIKEPESEKPPCPHFELAGP